MFTVFPVLSEFFDKGHRNQASFRTLECAPGSVKLSSLKSFQNFSQIVTKNDRTAMGTDCWYIRFHEFSEMSHRILVSSNGVLILIAA